MGAMTYTTSGKIIRIKSPDEATINSLKITFFPKQIGSGEPSLTNIIPITGRTGLTITKSGKNVFNYSEANISDRHIRNDSGIVINDNGNSFCQAFIPVLPNTKFTLSGASNAYAFAKRFYYFDINNNFIKRSNGWVDTIYTELIPSNCYNIQIQSEREEYQDWSKIQLEIGQTASSFQAYKGINYSINWETQAGEVYGGTIDLITGTLIVKYKLLTLTGTESNAIINWKSYTFICQDSVDSNSGVHIIACSHTNNFTSGVQVWQTRSEGLDVCCASSSGAQIRFRNRNAGQTIEEYKAWLQGQYANGTPVQIIYELANPITYQLSSQQLKTFDGITNIWSENNDVQINYDLHETTEIIEIKKKIMSITNNRELPFGYKEIEYISATGKQYIATDYVPKIGDQITTKFLLTSASGAGMQGLFSAGTGDYQLIFLKYNNQGISAYYKYFATGGATELKWHLAYNEWHDLTINSNGYITSGDKTGTSAPTNELDGNLTSLYLFIRRNSNYPMTGSLGKFTITHNNKKTLELIPCIQESSNIAGMYDTVAKKFYGSSGSQQFIAGPDI